MIEKLIVRAVLLSFFFNSIGPLQVVSAQTMPGLPAPGTMVDFSPKFNQASLKGIVFYPQDPYKFDFILDEGDAGLSRLQSKEQSQKIAAYFLASLTTPEKEIWVNLSPFEKGRIIPPFFGDTLMGQNLLAQDYMLKQIMATALYPERQLGREFWKKIYTQALVRFGTTDISINTFNKVWIVPDKAVVYENTKMNAVFIAQSSLKVMLEKDYLSEYKHRSGFNKLPPAVLDSVASTMSSAVVKELVIPALEKEVNEGRNFAPLRQVYNALILAKWYKDNLKDNLIARGYIDRDKIAGVESHDKQRVSEIYRLYIKAYKKGVFNFIREDFDEASQSMVPRKYFSGGFMGSVHVTQTTNRAMTAAGLSRVLIASVVLTVATSSLPGASAQQTAQEAASSAIGAGQPAVSSADDQSLEQKLKLIKDAVNGQDPQAASEAFRQIPDTSAVEYAARILRLSPGGSWDKPLSNLLSNSSGPDIADGFSPLAAVTNLGVAQSLVETVKTIRERKNIGNSTLRLEAAFYLMRVADQIKSDSGLLQKLTRKGVWESLNTKNETDNTVKAARLLTQAVLIREGIESRTLAGGSAIQGLEQIEVELHSSDWIVRYSALAVLDAIAQGDPDNRYQGMIARFLQQPADQLTDIQLYEMAAGIAVKHGMVTALPGIIRNIEMYSKARPEDTVGLLNWHRHMQALMQLAIRLSNGDKDLLTANLEAMAGHLTESGTTDAFNTLQSGFLFYLGHPDYLTIDKGASLKQLMDGTNVEQNTRGIIDEGGPMYFPDLLAIFKLTNNSATVNAVLSNMDSILSTGVYPRENNPWTAAIDAKAGDPNLTISEAVTAYEQRAGAGQALSRSLANANSRAQGLEALQLLAAAPAQQDIDHLKDVIQFVFSGQDHDPVFDSTETGQTAAFNKVIRLAALVIVKAGLDDQGLKVLLDRYTTTDETSPITRQKLEHAVAAIKEGEDLQSTTEGGGFEDGINAGKILSNYLKGENGFTKARAVNALNFAYRTFKNPFDPRSAETIIDTLIQANISDQVKLQMLLEVFIGLEDKDLEYDSLGKLLDHRSLSLDMQIYKLFRLASQRQIELAASKIIDAYLSAYSHRDIWGNQGSALNVADIQKAVSALGSPLLEEKNRRLNDHINNEPGQQIALGALNLNHSPVIITEHAKTAVGHISDSMETKNYSVQDLLDLNRSLNFSKFNDESELRKLLLMLARAHQKLKGNALSTIAYQQMKDLYLAKFKEAQSAQTQADAFYLSLSTPTLIAPDLSWDVLDLLAKTHPDFGSDEQQSHELFTALNSMKRFMDALKSDDPDKYKEIVGRIKSGLANQGEARRFDNIIQFIFLQSVTGGPSAADMKSLGIIYVPEDQHYLNPPSIPYVTLLSGEKEITHDYVLLADKLNMIKSRIFDYRKQRPGKDLFTSLERLFKPSDPTGQLAAMEELGGLTLLFQDQIPYEGDPDVRLYLFYINAQYQVAGDHPKMEFPQTAPKFSNSQEAILLMPQLLKRGAKARSLAIGYLQDDGLYKYHPEVINELTYQIGKYGSQDMVEPLLRFYVHRDLLGINVPFTGIRKENSYLGVTVRNALIGMGGRYKIKPIIADFNYRLSLREPENWSRVDPTLEELIKEIPGPDKAMTVNGGIDLEGISVRSQNEGSVTTAFDDHTQLDILLRSNGLVPVIEEVKPLSQPAVDQLLGMT